MNDFFIYCALVHCFTMPEKCFLSLFTVQWIDSICIIIRSLSLLMSSSWSLIIAFWLAITADESSFIWWRAHPTLSHAKWSKFQYNFLFHLLWQFSEFVASPALSLGKRKNRSKRIPDPLLHIVVRFWIVAHGERCQGYSGAIYTVHTLAGQRVCWTARVSKLTSTQN